MSPQRWYPVSTTNQQHMHWAVACLTQQKAQMRHSMPKGAYRIRAAAASIHRAPSALHSTVTALAPPTASTRTHWGAGWCRPHTCSDGSEPSLTQGCGSPSPAPAPGTRAEAWPQTLTSRPAYETRRLAAERLTRTSHSGRGTPRMVAAEMAITCLATNLQIHFPVNNTIPKETSR